MIAELVLLALVTIRTDCKAVAVGADLKAKACAVAKSKDTFEITFEGKKKTSSLRVAVDPQGTFDDRVAITVTDGRYAAIAYENAECGVVKIFDVTKNRVAADSGCMNSTYCSVAALPRSAECTAHLVCGDGSGKKQGETKKALAVCGASAPGP